MSNNQKRAHVPDAEEVPGDPGTAWESWAQPEEVDTFDLFVKRFWNKEITEDEFRQFRLQNGVYGQNQPDMQMVRIKIPAGGLTAEQVDTLADLARLTPRGVAHVTTRQNVQYHFVKLEDSTAWLQKINAVGLTTREACSNTMRTMTACHRSGVCATEAFDVSPYAAAASQYFLRNPLNQSLPRKFKVSFSGCASDCALPLIHDLGAVAKLRRAADGSEQRGFEIYVGGGLGSSPRPAKLLEEFTPEADLLCTMAAVVRVFDRHGNREQRALSRLKYTVDKLGIEKFRELVLADRAKIKLAAAGQLPDLTPWVETPGGDNRPAPETIPGGDAEYERWLSTNVMPQKQNGYSLVHVRLELGDITADQLAAVAKVVRDFSNGTLRTTIQQNLALRWIRQERLPEVYAALRAAALVLPSAERLGDVTSCPGADTCQLGITSSRGMARAIGKELSCASSLADVPGVRVKISGCPNSCGQHHIASIGLFGGARTVEGRVAPTYQMMLGGGLGGADGAPPFGSAFMKFPAANAPEAVRKIVEIYQRHKQPGETFNAFVDRYGRDALKAELAPLAELPSYDRDPSKYRDVATEKEEVGKRETFVVKLGKGECAT